MKKEIEDNMLKDAANAKLVQNKQIEKTSERVKSLSKDVSKLTSLNDHNLSNIDNLILASKKLLEGNDIQENNDIIQFSDFDYDNLEQDILLYEDLETISVEDISWNDYLKNISKYAEKNAINLTKDPFEELLSEKERKEIYERVKTDYSLKQASCDKYDYMLATFSGVISGVIDSFFVGMPEKTKLGNWSDKQIDEWIINLAKIRGYEPENGNHTISGSIAFFERKYKVNYDQPTGKSAANLLGMSTSNHHVKSLGHAPDLFGLIFSILDQFSSTSHFLDNGRLIVFDTDTSTLKGNNFVAKLFCGISNWVGHLISDMAGSSGTRKKPDSRGSGVPMPLFELFQTIGKGSFMIHANNDKLRDSREFSFADLSVKVFESGYDARFALAQAVPVAINELTIRLLWLLKSIYFENKSWKDSLSLKSDPNLRRMLLTGHGVLCIIDTIDAGLRSKNQILLFALHLNFTAWKRLAFSGLVEIRSIYIDSAIDLNSLERDLELEWNRIYKEI